MEYVVEDVTRTAQAEVYEMKTGDDHDGDDGVALLGGEVLLDVCGRPIFNEDRRNKQDGNGEQVVVVHGCSGLVHVIETFFGGTHCRNP
jgi:hypothetical protein